jgi:hypothetical protein
MQKSGILKYLKHIFIMPVHDFYLNVFSGGSLSLILFVGAGLAVKQRNAPI